MKLLPKRMIGLLMALGLLAGAQPRASADTYKVIDLVGSVTLASCSGMGYPIGVVPGTTVKNDPKGLPQENIAPGGPTCVFNMTSVCLKSSAGKKISPLSICTFTANGVLTGYCGMATGSGTATIIDPTKSIITTPIKLTVTNVAYITGGTMQTNIRGTAPMLPTTGTCATNSATGFTTGGNLLYKDCTDAGTVATFCDAP